MTTSIRSEATRSVVVVNGVDTMAVNADGTVEALNPQPATGNDFVPASQVLGIGQTWQDVTGSRAKATPYTNSTGKPIVVSVNPTATSSATASITVSGVVIQSLAFGSATVTAPLSVVVPAGATYQFDTSTTILRWMELRT